MTRLKEFSPDDTKLKEKMSSHSNREKTEISSGARLI